MATIQRFKDAILFLQKNKIVGKKQEIASKLNVTPQTLTEILGGRMRFTVDTMEIFCNYYNISADWLLTGKGEMLRSSVVPINNTQNNNHSDNCTQNNYNNCDVLRLMEKMVDVLKEEIETIKNK